MQKSFTRAVAQLPPPTTATFNFLLIIILELLQDLREKNTKQLQLKISTRLVNEDLIKRLNQLFTDHQGSCPIQFTVFDTIEGIEINLPSKSVRVNPSNELFKELAKLDVKQKLN